LSPGSRLELWAVLVTGGFVLWDDSGPSLDRLLLFVWLIAIIDTAATPR
jgi:uncharacterized membrane protein